MEMVCGRVFLVLSADEQCFAKVRRLEVGEGTPALWLESDPEEFLKRLGRLPDEEARWHRDTCTAVILDLTAPTEPLPDCVPRYRPKPKPKPKQRPKRGGASAAQSRVPDLALRVASSIALLGQMRMYTPG